MTTGDKIKLSLVDNTTVSGTIHEVDERADTITIKLENNNLLLIDNDDIKVMTIRRK